MEEEDDDDEEEEEKGKRGGGGGGGADLWEVGCPLIYSRVAFFFLDVLSIGPDLNWLPIKRCAYLTSVPPLDPPTTTPLSR